MYNFTYFTLKTSMAFSMAGLVNISSSHFDNKNDHTHVVNEFKIDYEKRPVISSTLYFPRKSYFKMYENFRRSRLFAEIYDGQSIGDSISIED